MGGGPGAGNGVRLRSLERWQVGVGVGCLVELGEGVRLGSCLNLKFECGGPELLKRYMATLLVELFLGSVFDCLTELCDIHRYCLRLNFCLKETLAGHHEWLSSVHWETKSSSEGERCGKILQGLRTDQRY